MASPPLSAQERKRAARIYSQARWAVWLGLGIVGVAIYAGVLFFWDDGFLQSLLWACLFGFTVWAGEYFAEQQVQKAGLLRAMQERLIITRTGAVQTPRVEVEKKATHSVRSILYRGRFIVFALCWAFFFGLFQLGSIGFESWKITFGYATVATIPALVVTLFFSFATQEPYSRLKGAGPNDDLLLQAVFWEQVATVEVVQIWNFQSSPVEYHFIFRSETGKVLQRVEVTPDKAAKILGSVEARLSGE